MLLLLVNVTFVICEWKPLCKDVCFWASPVTLGCILFQTFGETPWVKHTHALWSYKARPQQGVGVGIMLVSKERTVEMQYLGCIGSGRGQPATTLWSISLPQNSGFSWRGCLCLMSRGWGKLALGAQPSTNSEKLCKISPFWDNFSNAPPFQKLDRMMNHQCAQDSSLTGYAPALIWSSNNGQVVLG